MKIAVTTLVILIALSSSAYPGKIDKMMREELLRDEVSSDRYPPAIGYGIQEDEARKSVPLALFMSAALPGAGEYYMGSRTRSKVFFGIEAAAWASYLAFVYHGRRVRDDYKLFAAANAGASSGVGSEDYWNAIEWNMTNEDYNERVREEARALYPEDLDRQKQYIDEHSYGGSLAWSWEGDEYAEEFRRLRRESRDAFQFAVYSTGVAILNRLASLMDVIIMGRSGEKKPPTGKRVQLQFGLEEDTAGFRIGIALKG
jgi:hypothetical protein